MRLKYVEFDESMVKGGIKPFTLKRLNDVVCLAGKNGFGKTRALNLIQSFINQIRAFMY